MLPKRLVLLLLLLPPLQTLAMDNSSPQDKPAISIVVASPEPADAQFFEAATVLMHSPNAGARPIQDAVQQIGVQATQAMADFSLEEAETLAIHEDPAIDHFEKQMAKIQENIRQLQAVSNSFYESYQGTSAELAAAKTMRDYAEQALAQQKRYEIGAFAGIGSGLFTWIYRLNPFTVYRTAYLATATRFTGIEIAAAAGAAGSAAKALLGPIACIVVLGIVWHQFKSWIIEPYRQKQKREIDKFKEALEKHKKENAQKIEQIHGDVGAARTAMGQALDGLRTHVQEQNRHVDKQLEQMQGAHAQHLQTVKEDTHAFKQAMSEAQAKTLAEVEERNRKLREKIEAENKDLQAQLMNDQAEFTTVVNQFTTGLKDQFDHVRDDVDSMKSTNEQMKGKVDEAVGKLAAALITMKKIKETTVEELTLLRKTPKLAGAPGLLITSPRLGGGSERKEKATR